MKTIAAILAGGHSTRMGRDKANLTRAGVSWLERTARLASTCALQVLAVGRERPRAWPRDLKVEFVPDAVPDCGPLGGLLAALRWAKTHEASRVLALPCDLPHLELGALQWLLAQPCGRDGVAVKRGGELEPLFSIYDVGLIEPVGQRLASGRRSLHGLIESGQFEIVTCPSEWESALWNCNTPEDWARLKNENLENEKTA